MPPEVIRLIPNLSVSALKEKLDKVLSLWYCLRAINHWGSGRLDQSKAIYTLIHDFNYSKSAAYRVLNEGLGKFWDRQTRNGATTICLYGLEKVAQYFNTWCGRYYLEIHIADFVGNGNNRVATQRAWLYASFYKPQGDKALPISRASVQEATGVRRRSQQRYEKVTVKSVANYANRKDVRGRMIPILDLVSGKCRQWLVHKRLGNTYHCIAYKSARGMLRKVNAALNQSWIRGEAWKSRRFFDTVKSFIKCLHRDQESYVFVNVKDRLVEGRREWCIA